MSDRNEYLYVMLDVEGRCWYIRDNETERAPGLAALLADGWIPASETPFHSTSAYILIRLEREARDSKGFGFGGG